MKKKPLFRFREFLILMVSATTILTIVVSGVFIYQTRKASITADTIRKAQRSSIDLSRRVETLLSGIEQSLIPLIASSLYIDDSQTAEIVNSIMNSQPLVRAVYCIDGTGRTFATGTRTDTNPLRPDFLGIDFSYNPVYLKLLLDYEAVWSDKFVSVFSGDTCIAVGVRVGPHSAIAEVALESLRKLVMEASDEAEQVWVIDRRAELVVDTVHKGRSGIVNVGSIPEFSYIAQGLSLPRLVAIEDKFYHPAVARSVKLGWIFISAIPAGFNNPEIRTMLGNMLFFALAFIFAALCTLPLWTHRLSVQVKKLHALASGIAEGKAPAGEEIGSIFEFRELADILIAMYRQVSLRQDELTALNQRLEERVQERTLALEERNNELMAAMENRKRMQNLLVETEKQAALGRLVAGVAHELNTPIGNALMAVSSLEEDHEKFAARIAAGIKKTELEKILSDTREGLVIAQRNLQKAGELINSFKHVASDQTSSIRRRFTLDETLREVLLTIQPMLKRTRHALQTDISPSIELDSYPGVLGQIITNLITNALAHAWDEGEKGTISISAHPYKAGVRINVSDNGKGMDEEVARHIMEPFYTTKMGSGGTGLGLHIAHNAAVHILGGELTFTTAVQIGTTFFLDIPLAAPILDPAQ